MNLMILIEKLVGTRFLRHPLNSLVKYIILPSEDTSVMFSEVYLQYRGEPSRHFPRFNFGILDEEVRRRFFLKLQIV